MPDPAKSDPAKSDPSKSASPKPDARIPVAPFASAMDRLAAPAAARNRAALRVAWVCSVILLLAVVTACYIWRSDVLQFWPPSARLYHALGLTGDTPAAPR
jgi:hypothetical protein